MDGRDQCLLIFPFYEPCEYIQQRSSSTDGEKDRGTIC